MIWSHDKIYCEKDIDKNIGKNICKDISKDIGKNISKDISKNIGKNIGKRKNSPQEQEARDVAPPTPDSTHHQSLTHWSL